MKQASYFKTQKTIRLTKGASPYEFLRTVASSKRGLSVQEIGNKNDKAGSFLYFAERRNSGQGVTKFIRNKIVNKTVKSNLKRFGDNRKRIIYSITNKGKMLLKVKK